jgi:hypothetical protein
MLGDLANKNGGFTWFNPCLLPSEMMSSLFLRRSTCSKKRRMMKPGGITLKSWGQKTLFSGWWLSHEGSQLRTSSIHH